MICANNWKEQENYQEAKMVADPNVDFSIKLGDATLQYNASSKNAKLIPVLNRGELPKHTNKF